MKVVAVTDLIAGLAEPQEEGVGAICAIRPVDPPVVVPHFAARRQCAEVTALNIVPE